MFGNEVLVFQMRVLLTCTAAFRTMVSQLLRYERIETTVAKAKELRRIADKVVTIAKEASAASTASTF